MYTDPAFAPAAVKDHAVAHDANDFEVGQRHHLAMPVVISPNGEMRASGEDAPRVPAELVGMDRFLARDRIVERLRAMGLLIKVEPHHHSVRRCYRCDTVVERAVGSVVVRMRPLAEPACRRCATDTFAFFRNDGRLVREWLENIRADISRQRGGAIASRLVLRRLRASDGEP